MTDILVVEDNPVNRELIREVLELKGYRVSEAGNGEEAIALLRENSPAIAIIDIQMPRLSGIDLIKVIRLESRLARLKCLALTAYAMTGDRERVLEAGFDAYLSKPFEAKELIVTIEGLLARLE